MSIERWRIRALAAAARLGYEAGIVNEAVAALGHVFGSEWIETTCSAPHRGSPFRFDRHPLSVALEAGGAPQVVELLELSAYLRVAASLPGFDLMAAGLKPQYRQTLLPLAMAFRLSSVGATDLELEPEADDGRMADVSFRWKDQSFLMECYRPTIAGRPEDHTGRLIFNLMGELSSDEPPIAVGIKMRTSLTHAVRKRLVRAVSEAKATLLLSQGDPLLVEDSDYLISVAATREAGPGEDSLLVLHPSFPRLPNEKSQFFRIGVAPRSVLHGTAPMPPFATGSCVAIWEDDETIRARQLDPDSALERLVRKVKRKLSQTRGALEEARIVVVDTWVTDYLDQLDRDPERYIAQQVARQHANSPGVILTRRTWDEARQRYTYPTHLFGAEVSDALRELVSSFASWEPANSVPPRVKVGA